MQPDERFTKAERILKRREFRAVYDKGQRYPFPLFTAFVLNADRGCPRLGITVTKRIGSAVVRNRCKRLLREVFRRNKQQLPSPWDMVVNVRHSLVEATYKDVEHQFLDLIEKLKTDRRFTK
jgi:ribonuclease P protein component